MRVYGSGMFGSIGRWRCRTRCATVGNEFVVVRFQSAMLAPAASSADIVLTNGGLTECSVRAGEVIGA